MVNRLPSMLNFSEFLQYHPDILVTDERLSPHALAAKNLRRMLKTIHPTMTFNVRVRSGYDGGRVHVSWVNWPDPWNEWVSMDDMQLSVKMFRRPPRSSSVVSPEEQEYQRRFGSVDDISLCRVDASISDIAHREAQDLHRMVADEPGGPATVDAQRPRL